MRSANIMSYILYPFALLYGSIIELRNWLYRVGILKSHRFNLPIISIGNITVGGTGKTPHTEYIIRLLNHYSIALLSRGYGRESSGHIEYLAGMDASAIGDEPLQMALKFPNIKVAVNEKRVDGIKRLLKGGEYDAIVLDDAYQHRGVQPSLNILIVDYNQNIFTDHLLPLGRLREAAENRNRADIIVVSKVPSNITEASLLKLAHRLTNNGQEIFFSSIKYGKLYRLHNVGHCLPPQDLNLYTEIILLTGIATPERVVEYIKQYNSSITELFFRDHHRYSSKDIEQIERCCKGRKDSCIIITTEKDSTKLLSLTKESEIRDMIYVLPIEIEFLDRANHFNRVILNHIENFRDNKI